MFLHVDGYCLYVKIGFYIDFRRVQMLLLVKILAYPVKLPILILCDFCAVYSGHFPSNWHSII